MCEARTIARSSRTRAFSQNVVLLKLLIARRNWDGKNRPPNRWMRTLAAWEGILINLALGIMFGIGVIVFDVQFYH